MDILLSIFSVALFASTIRAATPLILAALAAFFPSAPGWSTLLWKGSC